MPPSESRLEDLDPAVVTAALAPLLLDERRARIDELLARRLGSLRLVVENLHDPHNGAAILRSAEAFGLQYVHVIESHEPFRASATVTQGADRWLDVVRHPTLADAVTHLRTQGFRLLATLPGTGNGLDDIDLSGPTAILVGNEHAGLSPEAIATVDGTVAIPMVGMTRSLNLSVASAILAQHLAERRRRVLGRSGDLEPATIARLRARFYAHDIRGAEAVVARHLAQGQKAPS